LEVKISFFKAFEDQKRNFISLLRSREREEPKEKKLNREERPKIFRRIRERQARGDGEEKKAFLWLALCRAEMYFSSVVVG
jgi:glycosylphosphatidylinositol transamidase (GPIT) subunit GPI8